MLGLGALIVGSGWALYNDIGGELFEDLHEGAANAMLAVVGVHIAGVLIASRLHHENLTGAMFSGRKPAAPEDGIRSAWRSVAALMLVAVLGFWGWQWQTRPDATLAGTEQATTAGAALAHAEQGQRKRHDDDD